MRQFVLVDDVLQDTDIAVADSRIGLQPLRHGRAIRCLAVTALVSRLFGPKADASKRPRTGLIKDIYEWLIGHRAQRQHTGRTLGESVALLRAAERWSASSGPERTFAAAFRGAVETMRSLRSGAAETGAAAGSDVPDQDAAEAALRYLAGEPEAMLAERGGPAGITAGALMHHLVDLLEEPGEEVRRLLRTKVRDPRTRERWSGTSAVSEV